MEVTKWSGKAKQTEIEKIQRLLYNNKEAEEENENENGNENEKEKEGKRAGIIWVGKQFASIYAHSNQ